MELMYDHQTLTFSIGNGFFVDVVTEKAMFSAWIYHEDYETKLMMCGFGKDPGTEPMSFGGFIQFIHNMVNNKEDIQEEIQIYREKCMTE